MAQKEDLSTKWRPKPHCASDAPTEVYYKKYIHSKSCTTAWGSPAHQLLKKHQTKTHTGLHTCPLIWIWGNVVYGMDKGSQAYAFKVGMTLSKQIISGYLEKVRLPFAWLISLKIFGFFMWTVIALCARIAMATESLCACTSSCTFCISSSSSRMRQVPTWLIYHLQNSITMKQTQTFHLYLKMFIEYSNIMSASLKISD